MSETCVVAVGMEKNRREHIKTEGNRYKEVKKQRGSFQERNAERGRERGKLSCVSLLVLVCEQVILFAYSRRQVPMDGFSGG